MLVNHGPSQQSSKEEYEPCKRGATARCYASHTKITLPARSLCQDPAGNQTTQRPPDHCKETQTEVVWTCLPFIRSCQNHLARHHERGKKTRQTEEEVGRQHQGIDRLEFTKSQWAVENREKWKKVVVKSSVVPQRPPLLRDRKKERKNVYAYETIVLNMVPKVHKRT